MSQFRLARISLLLAAVGLNAAPAMLGMNAALAAEKAETPAAAPKADSVRPEIFKLLDPNQVKELMAAKNYTEVQSRIDQVEAMPNKTEYENFVLNRMRVALGSASGNAELTNKGLIAVIDSGRLQPKDKLDFIQALGNSYYNSKDYANAVTTFKRYSAEGGDPAAVRSALLRSYFFSNDLATAKTEVLKDLAAHKAAGTKPPMELMQLQANIGTKNKDNQTYLDAVENLVTYYPEDKYWNDLLNRTRGKPTWNQRLDLDMLRLQNVAMTQMPDGDYYSDLAELDLQAGFFTEAKNALDKGFSLGLLGTGKDAAKHKQLRDKANKGAADDAKNIASGEAAAQKSKDGVGLVNLGYVYVTMGQYDKGLDLMKQGIAKGVAKNPDDAKLRLGYAYALAGKKDDAVSTLQQVKGDDGRGDLARYWAIWAKRDQTAAAAPAAK
ncbi:tetratricopeptide repeat protein [Oxalobacteraceae bacterium A2-2]